MRESRSRSAIVSHFKGGISLFERVSFSVGIYARLSVDLHDRKSDSIGAQIEIAKSYLADQSGFQLYDCYVDLGKSGMNFERGAWQRLLADIRQRRVNCIVVKDFSRFGRNHIEIGNYIEKIFPFLGVRFISITDQFDSFQPLNENEALKVNLKNLVNELYAKDIGRRIKLAKAMKKQQGGYTGGRPPYGYEIRMADNRRRLWPQKEEAAIVQEIFQNYSCGQTLGGLIESLYEKKVHRPTEYYRYRHIHQRPGEDLRRWSKDTLRGMLQNPVYGQVSDQQIVSALVYEPTVKRLKEEARTYDQTTRIKAEARTQAQTALPQTAVGAQKIQMLERSRGDCYFAYKTGKITREQFIDRNERSKAELLQLFNRRGNFPSS